MHCRKCGKEITNDGRFCPYCGYDYGKDPAKPSVEEKGRAADYYYIKRRKNKRTIRILLSIIILLLLGLGGYTGGTLWYRSSHSVIHTVSFNCLADEETLDFVPEGQQVHHGEKASCPAFPTREGYVFDAWYSDQACEEAYDFTSAVKEDIILYAGWLDEDSDQARWTEEEIEGFQNSVTELSAVYQEYVEEDGYILPENEEKAMAALEDCAETQKDHGQVTYYSREDNTLYLEYPGCLTYVLYIAQEGTDSGNDTNMIFPFSDTEEGRRILDEALEENCETWLDGRTTTSWNGDVLCTDGELLQNLDGCDVFIWHGHGGYTSQLGPYLLSREEPGIFSVTDWYVLGADLVFYNKLLQGKYITIAGSGDTNYYGITSKYVETYFPEMDEAIVFLGACQSGRDSRLSEAFIGLGASVVVCNMGTDNINTIYNVGNIYSILKYMCGQGDDGVYHTIDEALQLSKNEWGQTTYTVQIDWTGLQEGAELFEGILSRLDLTIQIDVGDTRPDYNLGSNGNLDYTMWAGLEGQLVSEEDPDSVSGVELTLLDESGATVCTAVSDSDGSFCLDKIANHQEGGYTLEGYSDGVNVLEVQDIWCQSHCYQNLGELEVNSQEVSMALAAYAKLLRSYTSSSKYEDPVFQLIYVDDNAVPELVIAEESFHMAGASLYTYYQGQVVKLGEFGAYGYFLYSEGNNLIQYEDYHTGTVVNMFWEIEDGKAVLLKEFWAEATGVDYEELTNFRIGSQLTSETEYQTQLDAITDGKLFAEAGFDTGVAITESNIKNILEKDFD